ncbi:MAG: hypothetical protein U1A78_26115 [Polyangia bacterium]
MTRTRRGGVTLSIVAALLTACASDDVVAVRRCDGGPCDSGGDGGTDSVFCQGSGPRISGAQDSRICGGALIANLLPAALCTCSGISGGDLLTDSFDSALGPYAPGQTGGELRSLGPLAPQGSWDVGGALRTSDATGVQILSGSLRVRGPAQIQGALRGETAVFERDADVGGGIGLVNLTVGGTLTAPDPAAIAVSGQRSTPSTRTAPVVVPPPCPCDLDPYVSGPILALTQTNDDTRLGLTKDQLEGFVGDPVLTLPCGGYFFQRVAGLGSLELRIQGRVELAIAGGLDVGGRLTISLAPEAELDLYVHGDITVGGAVAIGDKAAPPRLRLFPGGVDTIRLAGGGYVSAAVLGRRRDLITSAPLDVYGAMIAESASVNAALRLHYDPQVRSLSGSCGPPP